MFALRLPTHCDEQQQLENRIICEALTAEFCYFYFAELISFLSSTLISQLIL